MFGQDIFNCELSIVKREDTMLEIWVSSVDIYSYYIL